MTEKKTKDNLDLQVYELGYHLLPTIPEENVPSEVSKIHSLISENDGTIISEGNAAMRQLSYWITKKIDAKNLEFNKAYFGWIKFEIDRSDIKFIQSKIEENQNILRFILVKTVRENTLHVPKAPSFKRENNSDDREASKPEGDAAGTHEVSEAEIDKSIDELIIS